MTLKLGDTIRALRKRDGRTQEELATALGITCQAVSRWESGTAYPDMEFIPAIANFFGTTIDCLFGYEGDRDKRVQTILDQANAYGLPYRGNGPWFDECIALLREGLAEFPAHPKLTLALAEALSEAGWRRQGEWLYYDEDGHMQHRYDPGRKNTYWTEAIKLCEALAGQDTDVATDARATELLVMLYRNLGETHRAVAAAERMPHLKQCRELLLCSACDGVEEAAYIGDALLKLASSLGEQLVYGLINNEEHFQTDMPIRKIEGIIDLFHLLCDDGNFGPYHKDLVELHLYLSRLRWEQGCQSEAFTDLDKAYDHAVSLEKLADGERLCFTAPLVCHTTAALPEGNHLSRRVRALPEDWPIWCNPDYSKVQAEIQGDPRWIAWAEKCARFGTDE